MERSCSEIWVVIFKRIVEISKSKKKYFDLALSSNLLLKVTLNLSVRLFIRSNMTMNICDLYHSRDTHHEKGGSSTGVKYRSSGVVFV